MSTAGEPGSDGAPGRPADDAVVVAEVSVTDTIATRLDRYERVKSLAVYVGGGLGGLALFGDLARDAFADTPHWIRAAFITVVVIAAAFSALAYGGYEWAATQLRKLHPELANRTGNVTEGMPFWPTLFYRLSLILVPSAAALLVLACWWSAVAPSKLPSA